MELQPSTKIESQKEEVFMHAEGFAGHGQWSLKNMAGLRFAFLTVNVRIVILCDAASCNAQKCTTFHIILLPLSPGLVNDFCQPEIITARHYIPDTISQVS